VLFIPSIAACVRCLRDGCFHDWEIIDRKSHYWCYCASRGERPRYDTSDGGFLVRKVCLTCGKVVDQIAAEVERQRREMEEHESRQKRAEELLGQHRGRSCKATLDNYAQALEIVERAKTEAK
jgi:hypothetical protein